MHLQSHLSTYTCHRNRVRNVGWFGLPPKWHLSGRHLGGRHLGGKHLGGRHLGGKELFGLPPNNNGRQFKHWAADIDIYQPHTDSNMLVYSFPSKITLNRTHVRQACGASYSTRATGALRWRHNCQQTQASKSWASTLRSPAVSTMPSWVSFLTRPPTTDSAIARR